MRARLSFVLGLVAAAGLAALAAGGVAGLAAPGARVADMPGKATGGMAVDAEIVFAVDVSYSMDPDEQALQREGYVQALTSREFLDALKNGMHGRIGVTYVEWAGVFDQKTIMPWRLIDGPAAAARVADEIAQAPYRRAYRTSISGALMYAAPLFENNGYQGIRRIIDVSGDGTNNQGPPVTGLRDDVLAKGITINGLPIMLKRPNPSMMDIPDLDIYYEDCVIGGPGAFVVPIKERDQFKAATRTKLVLEMAGVTPERRVVPASAAAPRISCTIGERLWQERWGN